MSSQGSRSAHRPKAASARSSGLGLLQLSAAHHPKAHKAYVWPDLAIQVLPATPAPCYEPNADYRANLKRFSTPSPVKKRFLIRLIRPINGRTGIQNLPSCYGTGSNNARRHCSNPHPQNGHDPYQAYPELPKYEEEYFYHYLMHL